MSLSRTALCWIATMNWAHAINSRFTLSPRRRISSTANNLQLILELTSSWVAVILGLRRSLLLIVNGITMNMTIRIPRLHLHPQQSNHLPHILLSAIPSCAKSRSIGESTSLPLTGRTVIRAMTPRRTLLPLRRRWPPAISSKRQSIKTSRFPSSSVCPTAKNIACTVNQVKKFATSNDVWRCWRTAWSIPKRSVCSSVGNYYVRNNVALVDRDCFWIDRILFLFPLHFLSLGEWSLIDEYSSNNLFQLMMLIGHVLLLSGDRTAVWEARLQRNFVVQVILHDSPMPPNGALTTTSHVHTSTDHRQSTSNPTPVEVPDSSFIEQSWTSSEAFAPSL